MADILCKAKHIGFSGDDVLTTLNEERVGTLGLSTEVLDKIIDEELEQEFEKSSAFLNVAES